MNFKIFWRYLCSSILDLALSWLVGALIIGGFMGSNTIHLETNSKFLLSSLSALFWIFLYTTYVPFHYFNGQTLMQKAFGLGVEFPKNKIMTYSNLFILHVPAGNILPVATFGIFYIVNALFVVFYKKHVTLEEFFTNTRYYLTKEKTHINKTKFTINETKKIIHKVKKRKKR